MALDLDPKTTALVVIDLQHGIVARPSAPHAAVDVVARCARLAAACRARGSLVVLVRVGFDPAFRDRLTPPSDVAPPSGPLPPEWSELVPEMQPGPDDVVIQKRQWGAFYGTDLDLQLRRRGIRTLLLTGIATNFGVESTARDAWERAFHLVFVEDAMSTFEEAAHRFSIGTIFPRLGRVRASAEVLEALQRR
jgi:nicotinamidase-related amidase